MSVSMRRRWALHAVVISGVLLGVLILSLYGAGMSLAAVTKVSGSGYIFPETPTYKASFSMDISRDGANPPTGSLKYYYSRTRMNMVSSAITDLTSVGIGTAVTFSGNCTINNAAGYTYTATAKNGSPDSFHLSIYRNDGSLYYSAGPKNLSGGNLTVTDTIPPTVSITSPENLITVGSSPINVSGTVDDSSATVTVNGIPATIANGQFTVPNVTISEGMNTIVARAIDPANNVSTASVNISLDSTPPQIAITSPPDGYVAASSSITVTGIINDIVRGTVNESQGSVLVNGIEAGISNRNFIVESVPLSPGENTITAVGADQWSNTASTSITVNYDTTPRAMINMVSGNNQSGNIGSTLPEPFVVSVVDETGTPVAGATTIFRVTENNGMLTGSESGRAVAVVTGADGLARATLTLGTWAGSGNNKVEVTSTGVDGSVIFTASGLQKPPAAIYVAQGSQQRGAVNQLLPEPLVAFVTDEGHNPLGNVPVIFSAVEGGGHFANGLDTITVNTDSDGRATVAFTLGPTAGNDSNVMQATFEGNSGPPASFTATGLVPGDPGNTRISGVVLDNSNNPIPNVTMRVEGTTREALTDATGQFVIENVPVGPVHMIADGTTAGIRGVIEYPKLMYEMTTISGANNTVGMPIYLLPLDLANAKWVGGNEDVTYTIPDVPGFELTIKANSVTFPDGSKEGYISVTQVHADKVPMVPQIGQQPRFIITIQPPGAIFDPPAPITLPNVDGLAPGEKTNMYSFDHDLGIFVSIGTGTVSEDGMVIQSDPGVGVVKAGWHCGGNPATIGSANNCPECQKCTGNICMDDNGADCTDDGNECTDDKCQGGACVHPAKPDGTLVVVGDECKICENGIPMDIASASPTAMSFQSLAAAPDGNICEEVVYITIISLVPSNSLILGEDLTINYKIEPASTFFDTVTMEVRNSVGTLVVKKEGLPTSAGTHSTMWEKGKWNQSPHTGKYVNPKNSPYEIKLIGKKNEGTSEDTEPINTKLVIEADIKDDKPAGSTASMSAGLEDMLDALKIVMKQGGSETVISGAASITVTAGAPPDQRQKKDIRVDAPALNTLDDGVYDVLFRDLRDEIGNFPDEDKNPDNGIQPLIFRLELW